MRLVQITSWRVERKVVSLLKIKKVEKKVATTCKCKGSC